MKRRGSGHEARAARVERIGVLRERLAAAQAERVAEVAERGVAALLAHAMVMAEVAVGAEKGFSALTAMVERDPENAAVHLEAYLKRTVRSKAALAEDIKAARRTGGLRLRSAGPGGAGRRPRIPRGGRVRGRAGVPRGEAERERRPTLAIEDVVELARRPGRWSRRVEALLVLRTLAGHPLPTASRDMIVHACEQLAAPTQQRWVQPVAVEVLFRYAPSRAIAMTLTRFQRPGPGDDFLVRERLIEIAGRIKGAQWSEVTDIAMNDPSEHVRVTLARVLRNSIPLLHLATTDASDKVRAQALLHLLKRAPRNVETHLRSAVTTDRSAFVVVTAASCLTALARKKVLRERGETRQALVVAAQRADLKEPTRAAVLEELAAIEVLADPLLRVVYDLLSRVVEHAPLGGGVRVRGPVLLALGDDRIAQVLSVLSQNDFALSADRTPDGLVVYRGEARRWSFWRVVQELRSPLPSKRQGYTHSWGRRFAVASAPLRAAWPS